jgi:hypothetical protein
MYATIVPALDLDQLTQASDLIVVGKVASLRQIGITNLPLDSHQVTSRIEKGVISIDRVLKGEVRGGEVSIQFYIPETDIGWPSVTLDSYGIYFLNLRDDGMFVFANPYYPFTIAALGISSTGANAIDRVVAEISAVLSSPRSTSEQRLNALYLLSRSRSPASTASLSSLLNSSEQALRLSAAGALLERNDTHGLSLAVAALLHGSDGVSAVVRHNLSYAVAQGVRDPNAIPDLKKLLASTDPEIRRAAASALMHSQSPDAITPLLSTLADSDFEVRYYGVVALAEITGQMNWRPNMGDFRTDQEKYLKHWREWAATR